jgi:hypothetical protein
MRVRVEPEVGADTLRHTQTRAGTCRYAQARIGTRRHTQARAGTGRHAQAQTVTRRHKHRYFLFKTILVNSWLDTEAEGGR